MNAPIGLFDSGVGGLTVMQQIMDRLPKERLIYFGDTARVPYGNKGTNTIIRYSIENTVCIIEKNIKLLVVACNTASCVALSKLQQLFNLPIIGVIEPGALKAVSVTQKQRIAVLGTKGTIQSGAYQTTIKKLAPNATIFSIACPLLVHLVEEQWLDHPATRLVIREYLHPLKDQEVDTILLGCTHYPWLITLIQEEMGPDIKIVDSASTCAEQVARILDEKNLLSSHLEGSHQYYSSDDPEKFRQLSEQLLGRPIPSVGLLLPGH